jgi:hypothetical protein
LATFVVIYRGKKCVARSTTLLVITITVQLVDLGGLVAIVLATGPKFPEFKHSIGQLIFNGDKNP